MKKIIQIISILFIFLVIFFELSNVVIVIKFGQGDEITIGKAGIMNPTQDNPINKMSWSSVVNREIHTLDITEPSSKHMGVRYVSPLKQIPEDKYLTPFLYGPIRPTAFPATHLVQQHKSEDFYVRQINPIIDFNQDFESNYAFQQQLKYDIQTTMNQSGMKNSAILERNTELLPSDQSELNNTEIEQSGNYNQAYQQQHGVINIALIHQVGNANIAIQTQNGVFNVARAIQTGSINVSVQNQRSLFNNAEVNQSGILNSAKQTQNVELQGGFNDVLTTQGGANNSIVQKQNGTLNQLTCLQSGVGNIIVQTQTGTRNEAMIAQSSFGGVAIQSQNSGLTGSNTGNKAEINQSGGSENYAEQTQNSISSNFVLNNAVIRQNGLSNFARQSQTGETGYSIIAQKGRNNNSIVSQTAF
jgi:hypothetical protein